MPSHLHRTCSYNPTDIRAILRVETRGEVAVDEESGDGFAHRVRREGIARTPPRRAGRRTSGRHPGAASMQLHGTSRQIAGCSAGASELSNLAPSLPPASRTVAG